MADFTLTTNTSISLNFLIYLQNLYLSQLDREKNRFPSYRVPFSIFHEDFEKNFNALWEDVVSRIEANEVNDYKLFHEDKTLFSKSLFNEQAVSSVKFEDIYRSFQNWWGSFAGSFAIGRAADDKVSQLYHELANQQGEKVAAEKLYISILYDDCILAQLDKTEKINITSIPEIHIRYKDVVKRLSI